MKIHDIFKKKERTFSFEFFPSKDYPSTMSLGVNVGQLINLEPDFISVTYGAGGSNQKMSFDLLEYLQNGLGLTSMAHYTCVGATKEKVLGDLDYLHSINIENLMLLRGDPPKDLETFVATDKDFEHASDLVAIAAEQKRFSIGVAGYPETHPEAGSTEDDIKNLQYKVAQGAHFVTTQLFFDNKHYYDFVARARAAGIQTRIIPGIIPITNFKQIRRFAELSSAEIPPHIQERMEPIQDDKAKTYQVGVDIAIEQCQDLLKNGAPGIHFYTLNKSQATIDIFESLPAELKH